MFDHTGEERFIQVMMVLAEAVQQELTEFKVKVYAKGLEDLPIEDIEKGAWTLIRTRTTASWPKIAEIRESVNGRPEDEAQIALARLERAMTAQGAYRTVCFDDPVIHAIVRAFGGWPKCCAADLDEWKFKRIEFLKVYRSFAPNLHRVEVPLMLTGIHEMHPNGVPQIAYIGDRDKIDAWQRGVKAIEHKTGPAAVSGLIAQVLEGRTV